jgi:hypothetical protein
MLISDLNENFIKSAPEKSYIQQIFFVLFCDMDFVCCSNSFFGIIFLGSLFNIFFGSQISNYQHFCSDRPKNQFSGFLQAINQYFLEITLFVSIVTALHNTVEERGLDE